MAHVVFAPAATSDTFGILAKQVSAFNTEKKGGHTELHGEGFIALRAALDPAHARSAENPFFLRVTSLLLRVKSLDLLLHSPFDIRDGCYFTSSPEPDNRVRIPRQPLNLNSFFISAQVAGTYK